MTALFSNCVYVIYSSLNFIIYSSGKPELYLPKLVRPEDFYIVTTVEKFYN